MVDADGFAPQDPTIGESLEHTMYFLGLGLIFLALKYLLEIPPVVNWPWWVVLSPFALAVAWWSWADWSGYTKRKTMEKENARKQARIDKNKQALGINIKRRK